MVIVPAAGVVDASGKVVGTIDANGRAVGLDGKKLGEIQTALVDRSGKVVATETQVVRDANGKVIGATCRWQGD